MRRREFITLIGGATAGSSLAARAQQTAQLRRIGIVLSGNDKDPEMKGRVDSLRRGLTALGWVEGRNCSFEYRWPGSDPSRTEKASADIVRSAPDVIIAGNLLSARSLRKVTKTIPIIFVNVADPVGGGIVENLARTGGNITGFTAFEYSTAGKWLEILRDIAPTMKRVAFIFGGAEIGPTGENFYRILENVTPKMTLELSPIRVRNAADVQAGIDQFAAKPDGGLVVGAEPGGVLNRAAIIAAAARHRMPAMYPTRQTHAGDALRVGVGPSLSSQEIRPALLVDRPTSRTPSNAIGQSGYAHAFSQRLDLLPHLGF